LSGFKSVAIFYDGDCPICRNYASFNKLKRLAEHVELTDMRSLSSDEIENLIRMGVNPNDGVIVRTVDSSGKVIVYQKERALSVLAMLNSNKDGLSLLHRVFRNEKVAGFLYPFLFKFRLLLLKMLKINPKIG
jgi:predicted DCC family thiol-disulfide oxidoreductase YuxK